MQDLMILIKISQQTLNLHKFLLLKILEANSTNVFNDNQFMVQMLLNYWMMEQFRRKFQLGKR